MDDTLVGRPIMRRNIFRYGLWAFVAALLFAPPAHANMIVPPLFFMSWLAMVLALMPIIVIETIVLTVRAGTSLWDAGPTATLANLASTFIGIPLALVLHANFRGYLGAEPDRFQTFWQKFRMVVGHVQYADSNGPVARMPEWIWPAGAFVLMVLFFLASWVSESWVARILLDTYPAEGLNQAVFEANLITYGLLAGLFGVLLVLANRDPDLEDASTVDPELVSEFAERFQIYGEHAQRGFARLKATEAEIARRQYARLVRPADPATPGDLQAGKREAA